LTVKVEFLKEYSARTAAGETRTVAVGAVLDLSPEKATRLITAGIVLEVESVPAIWKWFVMSADSLYQSASIPITVEAWNLHKNHQQAAQACFDNGHIPEHGKN
jgi:hypothetical protein